MAFTLHRFGSPTACLSSLPVGWSLSPSNRRPHPYHSCCRAPVEDAEVKWPGVSVADRENPWDSPLHGTQMAWPVRQRGSDWRRWDQLGRWVNPDQDDTRLACKGHRRPTETVGSGPRQAESG
jgi:hypothetical protein